MPKPELVAKNRAEWDEMEARGLKPCCGQRDHAADCMGRWFEWGYAAGYHDGANGIERHGHALLVALLESGYLGDPDDR